MLLMKQFVRSIIILAGLISLTAAGLLIVATAFPELPPSRELRGYVTGAVQRWASPEEIPTPPTETAGVGKKQLYQCSMHPQIVSDKPGLCSICGMRLEPVEAGGPPQIAGKERKLLFY